MSFRIRGLVAAAHTPFTPQGDLNLSVIENQAEGLMRDGAFGAFVCGTTGECSSLTLDERLKVAERWLAVTKNSSLKVIVHVGSNCIEDSKVLAAHAEKHQAAAVSALAPSYFKPKDCAALVDCLAAIAAQCPRTPFYFYDIPSMTGVSFSAADVLTALHTRSPNINGAKFTNSDLFSYQRCLRLFDGRFDLPFGTDEALLAALALGGRGAVGSSYNFTTPLFRKLIAAVESSDLASARDLQFRGVELIGMLIGYGYLPASKIVMQSLGIDVGPTRLPISSLSKAAEAEIRTKWESLSSSIRG